ncbi:hypothetical protein IFM89_006357 [Coptis chinensis]|uniref:Protein SDA1 n=1 Tax=Coptis chinensis TaxID=261450 RepID=A0A835HR88_9MAGN|nr:hypothetical protein IFM89_006357 [Coptis chinensis]
MPSSNRPSHEPAYISTESFSASGLSSEKISLPTLQSKMKIDPEGYETELIQLYRHFDSSLHLFQQQSTLNLNSTGNNTTDPTISKDLGDMAMFLSHVTPFYPTHLSDFPNKLSHLLRSAAKSLPSSLRSHLAQALILLINRKMIDIGENLGLFMDLQTLGDRVLRKLCFSHVVHSIRRMNMKHKNDAKNRALQNIIFSMLQNEDEGKAKRALVVLCDLHRRRVWFDERTANAISTACFHSSSRIMISALSFLLGFERIEEGDGSDDSGDEDGMTPQNPQVIISREAVYKAHHKGTSASKKKKQAKLQRAVRTMKRQQRMSSEKTSPNHYSPLGHLKDAQGFAEKLFSRLQTCNERFEVKMMMLKVISRTIGLHRLILLNFYPFIQKYVQPHQRDITELLAAAVQACHDMVPPDAVEPLFRQVVNQFVHDRSRTEAIAVGLNVVREICLRIPLICPSLLVKKDRGRPTDPKARPKAFGEVNVSNTVHGIELLEDDDGDNESALSISDNEEAACTDDEPFAMATDSVNGDENEEITEDELSGDPSENDEMEEVESDDVDNIDDYEDDEEETDAVASEGDEEESGGDENEDKKEEEEDKGVSKTRKRKFVGDEGQLIAADTSLRALKRVGVKVKQSAATDGFLSNEDFQRIKQLEAKKEAKLALSQHGLIRKGSDAKPVAFKIPNAEQLSVKRVDPAKLEQNELAISVLQVHPLALLRLLHILFFAFQLNIKRKMSKEERLALIKAGREDRGKYQSRTAVKQKKTGGLSNRQKEHKKQMPLVAKRKKVARSRQEKKKQQRRAGTQFRGKKAWK